MNSVQKVGFDLLVEFRDICNDNGLKYFLSTSTVAEQLIFNGFGNGFRIPAVYMPVDDGMKLIDMVESGKLNGRSIDYMGNNENYPNFSAFFVNENSTYIKINQGTNYIKHGIKIRINFIRNDTSSRMLSIFETGWENNGFRQLKKSDLKLKLGRKFVGIWKKMNGEKSASKLFDKIREVYSDVDLNKKTFVKRFKRKRAYFPENFFLDPSEIKIEGEVFTVPSDIEKYIEIVHGKFWRDPVENMDNSIGTIIAPHVPYCEMLKNFENKGYSIEKLIAFESGKVDAMINKGEMLYAKNDAWNIARRSGDRLKHYENLMPKWDLIKKLKEAGDFKEISKLFYDYDNDTRYYLKKNLGLCPCKELLDVEVELLIAEGRKDLADKLVKLVPKEHLTPLGKE